MKKISRRNFIKTAGASSLLLSTDNPLGLLFNQVINSVAHAQTNNVKRFISFVALGAPPRWMFDQVLKLDGSPLNLSPLVGTNFDITKEGEISALYQTTKSSFTSKNGVEFFPPEMWDTEVNTSFGYSLKIKELFQKSMIIRGISTSANHPPAKLATHISGLSKAGVHTLAQEHYNNNAPISCIQYGVNFPFKARNGISCINLRYPDDSSFDEHNPIEEILRPFTPSVKPENNFSEKLSTIFDEAFNEFFKGEKIKSFSARSRESIKNSQKAARNLFIENTKSLIESYPLAYNKYKTIIADVLNGNNIFMENIPLPIKEDEFKNKFKWGSYSICKGDGIETFDDIFSSSNANIDQMASAFALTEVLCKSNGDGVLEHGLTNSTVSYTGEIKLKKIYGIDQDGKFYNFTDKQISNDCHEIGSLLTTYGFTKYYLSLSTCLGSLIKDGLGGFSSEKFKNTIIQFSGDFNRTPRVDEGGSDHGNSTVYTYFSGAIDGPLLAGANKVNSKSIYHDHGEAHYDYKETFPLRSINCFEGVAQFIGTESLTRSAESIFDYKDGKISIKEKYLAKNIDDS